MMPWKSFVARAGVAAGLFGVSLFTALRLASADPDGPPTRHALTIAGTLSGVPASPAPALVFVFRKMGSECRTTATGVRFDGAHFSAEIPIDGSPCRAFFDGADAMVDVEVNGARVVTGAAVNPVPYARFADTAGGLAERACPRGYTHDRAGSTAAMTLCVRTLTLGGTTVRDEVVKVGTGASAFWVDRYEASVWGTDGVQRGASDSNYPNLALNGQWAAGARGTLRAYSHAAVVPNRNVSWFQATALCDAAGKRLINRREWFAAADGLVALDPTAALDGNAAGETRCNTGGTDARRTGSGSGCASSWGAQDMIGNVWEWADEWYASVGQITSGALTQIGARVNGITANYDLQPWPTDGFGSDGTWNITSTVYNTSDSVIGVPSAALRGGVWLHGTRSGVFALALNYGPSNRLPHAGFRCVVPG